MGTGIGEAAAAEGVKAAAEVAAASEFGGAAIGSGLGAEAFGGGLASELAFGAPEFAGAFGLGEAGAGAVATGGAEVIGGAGVGEAAAGGELGAGVGGNAGGFGGAFDAGGVGTGVDAGTFASDAGLSQMEGFSSPSTLSAGGGGGDPLGTGVTDPVVDPEFPTETAPPSVPKTPFETAGEQVSQVVKNTPPGTSNLAQKAWDHIQKNPLTAAGLGLNAASAIAQRGNANAIPKKLEAIGKPISDASNDLLAQYKAGTINPGSEFDINKWEQQQIAVAKNYFAKSGQGSSTAANNKVAQIQAQANAMREQARTGLLTQGLNAAGMAVGPLTNAVTAQAQQDQQFMQSQSSALQSLMLLQALQSKQAGAA